MLGTVPREWEGWGKRGNRNQLPSNQRRANTDFGDEGLRSRTSLRRDELGMLWRIAAVIIDRVQKGRLRGVMAGGRVGGRVGGRAGKR